MKRRVPLLLGAPALLLCAARPALAQDAVPRGAAGAAVTPEDKPQPPAGPTAPPSGFTPPKLRKYSPPAYPPAAEKAGQEAKVTVMLDVDVQGHVTRATVPQPVGYGFDEAAIEAAKGLEFDPAKKSDGTPFASRFGYVYSFTLTPVAPAPGQKTVEEKKKPATLSGVVLVKGGDVPIAGAIVSLTPSGAESPTDLKGAFSFKDLEPGSYTVLITAPGYAPFSAVEPLGPGENVEIKYRLAPSTKGALEVTVKGDRPPREVTKRTIDADEIARIPGTNGDALKAIQNLPGVARPPGGLGLLIVRGSAPQDTQTFIDGTPVPLIYHFGGLSSVVPTEVLQKIDFYPGNFGAQYGRVQGGIVDVGLRAPKNEYHGLVNVDLIDARALFEGPIPGLSGWTFLAAGRRSYVDAWLGPVLQSAGAGVTQAPVYYDYQFMVNKKPTPDSNFRVAFFGSDDALALLLDKPSPGQPALAGNFGLHTAFQRLQLRYDDDLGGGDRVSVLLSFDRDELSFNAGSLFFDLDTRAITGRAEYSKRLAKGVTLDAGIDMFGGFALVDARLPPLPRPGQPPNGPFIGAVSQSASLASGAFQPAAYLEMELTPDSRSRIVPGVRLDYFNINNKWDIAPRINGRYDIHKEFPRTTVKAGAGVYQQPPQFQEVTPPFGTPTVGSNRAIQYSVGVEQEITKQLEFSLEGFYKQLDSQVISTASASGNAVTYTNDSTGYVGGGELLVKYKPDRHFFGWIAYTLSRSVRSDGYDANGVPLPQHLFQYDQPHILTILGSYNFRNGWEFGARFRLVSGSLVTPNACDQTLPGCSATRVNSLFNATTGTYTPIPASGQFSERLPIFHQLDLRVDRSFRFKTWKLSAYLDIQNVYNQSNVDGLSYNFNYTTRSFVSDLPILPSIGMRGEFPP
jgi:TonB family protein